MSAAGSADHTSQRPPPLTPSALAPALLVKLPLSTSCSALPLPTAETVAPEARPRLPTTFTSTVPVAAMPLVAPTVPMERLPVWA